MILHVTAPAAFGGLERVVQLLATGQRESGHDVHVAGVVDQVTDQPFLESLRERSVPVHEIAVSSRAYFRERATVRVLCQALRPDIVHTHGYRPDVIDAGVARRLGVPTVTTVHGFTGNSARNRAYEWLQRMAFRRFQAVVAVSQPLAKQLRASGIKNSRVHLVRNAWRPLSAPLPRAAARADLGVPDERFAIGWVGRLSPEKGLDLFVDALAFLADLPVTAVIIGDGPARREFEGRAARLGVADRMVWLPRVSDAARFYGGFDAFTLSSRTEGTPMVILEAMATRTPIVAAAVGGVPDMVSDAEALLVPAGDPRALAQALRAVVADPAAAAGRADAAAQRLQRDFAVGPWLSAYEAIYRGVRVAARQAGE